MASVACHSTVGPTNRSLILTGLLVWAIAFAAVGCGGPEPQFEVCAFPQKSLRAQPLIATSEQDQVRVLEAEDGQFTVAVDDRGVEVEMEVTYPAIGHPSPLSAGEVVHLLWRADEISFLSIRNVAGTILFQIGDPRANAATDESAFDFRFSEDPDLYCGRPCEGQYETAAVDFTSDEGTLRLFNGEQRDIRLDGRLYHAESFFAFDIILSPNTIDGSETIMEAMLVSIE